MNKIKAMDIDKIKIINRLLGRERYAEIFKYKSGYKIFCYNNDILFSEKFCYTKKGVIAKCKELQIPVIFEGLNLNKNESYI